MRGIRMLVLSTQEYEHMVGFDLRIADYSFSWQGFCNTEPLISRMVHGFLVNLMVPYHILNGFVGVDVKTPTQLQDETEFPTLHRVNMVGLRGYFITFDRKADKVLLVEYVSE